MIHDSLDILYDRVVNHHNWFCFKADSPFEIQRNIKVVREVGNIWYNYQINENKTLTIYSISTIIKPFHELSSFFRWFKIILISKYGINKNPYCFYNYIYE